MKDIRTPRLIAPRPALTLGLVLATVVAAFTQTQRDFTKELANKMAGTYVVAAVGDLWMQEPTGRRMSPAIQKILREADTTVGSMDLYLVDRSAGDNGLGTKELADDIVDLGFDVLVPGAGAPGAVGAGGRGGRGGPAGADGQAAALPALGIRTAGLNRQPVFQELSKGRVAVISGSNPISPSQTKYVTQEQLQQLKGIRDALVARRNDPDVSRPIAVPPDEPNQVTIFSDTYVVGPVAGEVRMEMNPGERQSTVAAVRGAKEYADFALFSMPLAPTLAGGHYSQEHQPPKSLIDLAHEMVDNGMDMFVGRGSHAMQGIEIYKGRAIFYSPGDLSVHRTDDFPAANGVAYIATSRYLDGTLQEVRIYPVDLGADRSQRPASKMGVPMTPSPEMAARILADVQKYSDPFGTKIVVENGVGVIRVPKEATLPIGQNISTFGGGRGAAPPAGGRGGRGRGGTD